MNFSYPLIRTRTDTYQGVRNVRFLENLVCFAFLLPSFWDSPFCLITNYFLHKLEKQLNDSYDNQNIDLKTDYTSAWSIYKICFLNSKRYINVL